MGDLQNEVADAARKRSIKYLDEFQPPIRIAVALCASYSALLRGEHGEPAPCEQLLAWARGRGRVFLSGRGASGKTTILHRLVLCAVDDGTVPFFIDLSQWDHSATEEWSSVSASARDALNFLLRRFTLLGFDITDVEFLPASVQKIFLIDGLNETPGSIPDGIISACDRIAALIVGCSVIVSDRLVRRNVEGNDRWYFAMPLPVDSDETARLIEGTQVPTGAESLLQIPFFLDRALRGELRKSPLSTIRELVETRGKLDVAGLKSVAEAAYRAYEVDKSRAFDKARFVAVGGAGVASTLLAGGILVDVGEDRVAFSHHWIHDYLASRFVADNPDFWNFGNRHRVLDILTFGANSFDAVAFVLEILPQESCESFLRAIYDWNPYAAGYALAEAEARGINEVPRSVRRVIFSNLAEKKLDRHFHSAQRAADALDLFSDLDAVALRSVRTHDELIVAVRSFKPETREFATWQKYFTAASGEIAPPELIGALADDNSILGWTAANVLKRLLFSNSQMNEVLELATHERPVVRWRACHVMGGFTDERFIQLLLDRVAHDKDENVRYGAMRSLIETASHDGATATHVADELIKHLDFIRGNPRVLGEFSRAVFLSQGFAPTGWVATMSRIFYALLESTDDMLEVERWARLASRVRIHHQVEAKLAA